jgi:hypothetical protein
MRDMCTSRREGEALTVILRRIHIELGNGSMGG